MGLIGVFILVFIVIHLIDFWARIKLGIGAEVALDKAGNKGFQGVKTGERRGNQAGILKPCSLGMLCSWL